jgi:hypothetical protein
MPPRSEITRLPARDMTEWQLMQSVTDLCRVFHLLCYHTRDSRGSSAGFPDLVIVGSSILFAELKSQHGKPTIEQNVWRDGIREAAGMWALWRPEHWHSGEIRQTLETLCCRAIRTYACIVCRARLPVDQGAQLDSGAWICTSHLAGGGNGD